MAYTTQSQRKANQFISAFPQVQWGVIEDFCWKLHTACTTKSKCQAKSSRQKARCSNQEIPPPLSTAKWQRGHMQQSQNPKEAAQFHFVWPIKKIPAAKRHWNPRHKISSTTGMEAHKIDDNYSWMRTDYLISSNDAGHECTMYRPWYWLRVTKNGWHWLAASKPTSWASGAEQPGIPMSINAHPERRSTSHPGLTRQLTSVCTATQPSEKN